MRNERRALLGGICLAGFLCAAVLALLPPTSVHAADPATQVVSLTIQYGDGVEKRFTALPWKKGTTAFDALQAAQAHARGIKFAHRGAGETLFVSQIDDLTNEGGGGRNWRYSVNDQGADRSCGIFELEAGDKVVWKFAK